MSQFYDQASLVMVPSGYKDGKLYSQKPLSTSGELAFSRGSDIEATRVNANGYIQKAQVNLVLQSNTFNTTWALQNSTISGGQSGYDGTSDAWLLERLSTGAASLYQMGSFSGIYTASIYAKAGTADAIRFRVDQTTDANLYVDLTDGSIITSDGIIGSNVESIGGGWYRISMAFNAVGYVNTQVRVIDGAGAAFAGNIYIQDAQLNYGLVAQDHQETTTAAVVSGITDNMPRLNYDPANPTCPSLLLEPSRTNLITQSEFFGDASWYKGNTTVTANNAISPSGYQDAYKIDFAAVANANIQRAAATATTIGTQYTISFYARADVATNNVKLSSVGVDTDLAITTVWQRFTRTVTATATTTASTLVTRDSAAASIYLWGFQFEAGSYPTSYIPTYGSSATRTADAAYKTGIASLIGQTEGTIFVEAEYIDGVNDARVSLSDGTTNNWIFLGAPEPSGGNIKMRAYITAGGAIQVNKFSGTNVTKGVHKYALAYKANDVVMYLDGQNEGSDALATIPACSRLNITGNLPTSTDVLISEGIKQVILFPTRLTNAQLAELTTL